MKATIRLQASSKELLEFIRELAKALEDRRLSTREVFRIAPELVDFVMTLKRGKEIITEWKMLTFAEKRELTLEAVINLKEQIEGDIIDLRLKQLEKVMAVVGAIEDTIQIEKQIKQLKSAA